MNCSDYATLISRFLDGVLSPEEHRFLFRHLGECAVCATKLTSYREQERGLRRLEIAQPRADLRERIWNAACAADAAPLFRRSRQAMFARLAIAGSVAVLAVLFLAFWFLPRPFAREADQYAAAAPSATASPVAAVPVAPGAGEVGVQAEADATIARQLVLAVMNNELLYRDPRIPLPGYLPEGSTVERVLLERSRPAKEGVHVEVVFASPQGTLLKLEHFPSGILQSGAQRVAVEGRILIDGREWFYGRSSVNTRSGPTMVLLTEDSGKMISVEGTTSLAELVRITESLR